MIDPEQGTQTQFVSTVPPGPKRKSSFRTKVRRHPAAVSRIVAGGASATLTFAFVAAMAATSQTSTTQLKTKVAPADISTAGIAPASPPVVVVVKTRYVIASSLPAADVVPVAVSGQPTAVASPSSPSKSASQPTTKPASKPIGSPTPSPTPSPTAAPAPKPTAAPPTAPKTAPPAPPCTASVCP